jgi:hypothetical protein
MYSLSRRERFGSNCISNAESSGTCDKLYEVLSYTKLIQLIYLFGSNHANHNSAESLFVGLLRYFHLKYERESMNKCLKKIIDELFAFEIVSRPIYCKEFD